MSGSAHVVLVVLGAAALTACVPAVVRPVPEDGPGTAAAAVVERFYGWYLREVRAGRNPLATGTYRARPELAPAFAAEVELIVAGFERGGYDPFSCAQDVPTWLSVHTVETTGRRALVRITTSFPDHGFCVLLELDENVWRIDAVRCRIAPAPAVAVPAAPTPAARGSGS